ncbi:MAG: type II toxin-antitoxin system HicA family toxin [Chloroflexi bacterium]|nr:type II toxin-antitoxin system HicA family toxin [Chloroflexota bacterium]
MKLPRDLAGAELATRLNRYGYSVTRQTGSHLRLTSSSMGTQHHISIPGHSPLKVGTLGAILLDVAVYLEMDRQALAEQLFA